MHKSMLAVATALTIALTPAQASAAEMSGQAVMISNEDSLLSSAFGSLLKLFGFEVCVMKGSEVICEK